MKDKEPVTVSKHHLEFYTSGKAATWRGNIRGKLMQTLTPLYCVGTKSEIDDYLYVHQRVHDAILTGKFVEVPDSEQDTICKACVKLDCRLSSVHHDLNLVSFWTRMGVQEQVIEDLNREMSAGYLDDPDKLKQANEFSIKRASKLLGE